MKTVFVLLCLLLYPVLSAHALEISFKASGTVDEATVRLGDVVDFDLQTEMARALATLPVGPAPAPGEKISLRAIDIKESVIGSQNLPADIHWIGSPTITLLRNGISIGPDKIEKIIADFIEKNRNHLPEAEIRFIPDSLPLPFTLPMGELSFELTPSNPNILGSSRMSIIFRIDDTVVKNMSVRGAVEAMAQIVVCTTSLKRGEILRPQHLTTALMDINGIDNPGFAAEDFIGKKLQRSLRVGSAVLSSMVESLPIVRRGERVKIVVNSGPLHLTATGLADSDGVKDEMIQVRNINSNKMVYCRVAAPGLVEVLL